MLAYEAIINHVETLVKQLEKNAFESTGNVALATHINGGIDAVVQILEIANNWKKRIDAAMLKIQNDANAKAAELNAAVAAQAAALEAAKVAALSAKELSA